MRFRLRPSVATVRAVGVVAVVAVAAVAAPAHEPVLRAASPAAPAAAGCAAPGGARVPSAPLPPGAEVLVTGHGWGHGMGMSQWGAYGAARLGCGYRTILRTYYSGVTLTERSLDAQVRLTLATRARSATLRSGTAPVVWGTSPAATVSQPAGTTWRVLPLADGGAELRDDQGERRLVAAEGGFVQAWHRGRPVTVTAGSTTLTTRWDALRVVPQNGRLAVTQRIGSSHGWTAAQKYLFGLAEIGVRWPVEAMKAQAVAARTFLLTKYRRAENAFVIGTTAADQVYAGFTREHLDARNGGRWRAAVVATDREVLLVGGRPIEALYSSSMGGWTEDRQYVYGRYGIDYLKAVDDSRWDLAAPNPYRSWSKGFTRAAFAQALGFDTVSAWALEGRGSGGRVDGLRVTGTKDGAARTVSFTGARARSLLGVRSPGFVVVAVTGATAAGRTPTTTSTVTAGFGGGPYGGGPYVGGPYGAVHGRDAGVSAGR